MEYIDSILLFFQWVWDFLTTGIYDFLRDGMMLLTKGAIYSYIQIQLFALNVAFHAAQSFMTDFGVSQQLRTYWGQIPGDVAAGLNFFGIPQALNIIFSALSTRFVLKFVPFIGR